MKKSFVLILAFAACLCAQTGPTSPADAAATVLSSFGRGNDILIGTGVASGYINQQAASLSSVSWRIGSIGGAPTYATSTYGLSFGSISTALKTGNFQQASSALVAKAGITQVLWRPKPHAFFSVTTQMGVVKFDWATLRDFDGSVDFWYDVGGRMTKDKYHVYIGGGPLEVSVAGKQIKPAYAIQIVTGFNR